MPQLSAIFRAHIATHTINRVGWLRAAILGANDGILSLASILSGMAAGHAARDSILLAGVAALVAGAASMATGEYVSVSSQSDTEKADLAREKLSLDTNPVFELEELTQIYVSRGLELALAKQVAQQLMAYDALGAHARDELGISSVVNAKPLQAAIVSAACFTSGATLPLAIATIVPLTNMLQAVVAASLLSLAVLGAAGAKTAGVGLWKPTLRVFVCGTISMVLTTTVGWIFNVSV